MPEDPLNEDTPETTEVEIEAPVEDTPESPESIVDWKDRYENLRSLNDRRFAEAQEQIRQYEEQLTAARQEQQPRNYNDEYDEDDDPLVRHLQQVEARLAAQEQRLSARDEAETLQQRQEEEYTHIDRQLEAIEQKFNIKLSENISNRLGRDAALVRDEDGLPDVWRAYAEWKADIEAEKQGWVETKPTGGKPAAGPGAVEVPDLDDPDEVDRLLNEAFDRQFGA